MKKFRFLLLDANVVIHLFELGLWRQVLEKCDVLLARTVAEREALFYFDAQDQRFEIDLWNDISEKRVAIVDVAARDLKRFCDRFDPLYLERLDAGEAESLAYLVGATDPCQISSSDAIVFRVLAQLNLADRGISLEEVLQGIGLARPLADQFTQRFRDGWTKRGGQEHIQGIGLKPKR